MQKSLSKFLPKTRKTGLDKRVLGLFRQFFCIQEMYLFQQQEAPILIPACDWVFLIYCTVLFVPFLIQAGYAVKSWNKLCIAFCNLVVCLEILRFSIFVLDHSVSLLCTHPITHADNQVPVWALEDIETGLASATTFRTLGLVFPTWLRQPTLFSASVDRGNAHQEDKVRDGSKKHYASILPLF